MSCSVRLTFAYVTVPRSTSVLQHALRISPLNPISYHANKPFSTASDGGNGAVQRGMPKQTVATWHCQMLLTNITVISASFRSLCARIHRKTQINRHGQSILPIPINKHTPWISSLAKGSAMADTAQPTETGSDKLFRYACSGDSSHNLIVVYIGLQLSRLKQLWL